jgi:hypothetical protein
MADAKPFELRIDGWRLFALTRVPLFCTQIRECLAMRNAKVQAVGTGLNTMY